MVNVEGRLLVNETDVVMDFGTSYKVDCTINAPDSYMSYKVDNTAVVMCSWGKWLMEGLRHLQYRE